MNNTSRCHLIKCSKLKSIKKQWDKLEWCTLIGLDGKDRDSHHCYTCQKCLSDSNYDEISKNPKVKGFMQNNWLSIFPCVQVMKIKEKLGTIPD